MTQSNNTKIYNTITKATDSKLQKTNWNFNFKLIIYLIKNPVFTTIYAKSLIKRLKKNNENVRKLTLNLIHASVLYIQDFIMELTNENFFKIFLKICKKKPQVFSVQYSLYLLEKWKQEFSYLEAFNLGYLELRRSGINFPNGTNFSSVPEFPNKYKHLIRNNKSNSKKQSSTNNQNHQGKVKLSKNEINQKIEKELSIVSEATNLLNEILINWDEKKNIKYDKLTQKLVSDCKKIQLRLLKLIEKVLSNEYLSKIVLKHNDQVSLTLNLYQDILNFGKISKENLKIYQRQNNNDVRRRENKKTQLGGEEEEEEIIIVDTNKKHRQENSFGKNEKNYSNYVETNKLGIRSRNKSSNINHEESLEEYYSDEKENSNPEFDSQSNSEPEITNRVGKNIIDNLENNQKINQEKKENDIWDYLTNNNNEQTKKVENSKGNDIEEERGKVKGGIEENLINFDPIINKKQYNDLSSTNKVSNNELNPQVINLNFNMDFTEKKSNNQSNVDHEFDQYFSSRKNDQKK
ncbi:tom1-like protein [Anaeramoeba flamelloides]|uniref:Tom1-like protein n=1 Tax=Anaeramoeba flamelloides TaxID=1746091 RepID=A0AAV7ZMB0_9EUKA|nr:tom1-like protein [Anaeramoeba flamelloides]